MSAILFDFFGTPVSYSPYSPGIPVRPISRIPVRRESLPFWSTRGKQPMFRLNGGSIPSSIFLPGSLYRAERNELGVGPGAIVAVVVGRRRRVRRQCRTPDRR
jgi:hypothetical protein